MVHKNPITAHVLDPTSDRTTNPNVNDTLPICVPTSPMRLSFVPETMISLHGERNATNEGESTAVHETEQLRSVIRNDPTPGILLGAYNDRSGPISTSRQAIMNELSERVVINLTKRLATINARNNDERATLRARTIQLETRLR